MTASITFSGTPAATYSVPGTHQIYDGNLTFAADGISVYIDNNGEFVQFVENTAGSGIIYAEALIDWQTIPITNEAGLCFINSSRTGFSFIVQGTGIKFRKEVTGSGGANIATGTRTFTGVTTLRVTFNTSTGAISATENGVEFLTGTYTDTLTGLRGGIQHYRDSLDGQRYRTLNTNTGTLPVTIDIEPDDVRVTESRTIRLTAPTTAITDANTDVYINDEGNAPIAPGFYSVVSGLTVDLDFTVPDEYAGLPYNATGYPVIISTVDGEVTSGNIPFLPVAGNDYVTLTNVSATDIESSPALEVGDQIEWTNAAVITIGADGKVTSTEESAAFEFRVWDHNDSTWGDWAEVVFGESGGSTGVLTTSGLTVAGLTRSGLSS